MFASCLRPCCFLVCVLLRSYLCFCFRSCLCSYSCLVFFSILCKKNQILLQTNSVTNSVWGQFGLLEEFWGFSRPLNFSFVCLTIERIAQLPIKFGSVKLIEWRAVYYHKQILKRKHYKKEVAESLKKKERKKESGCYWVISLFLYFFYWVC